MTAWSGKSRTSVARFAGPEFELTYGCVMALLFGLRDVRAGGAQDQFYIGETNAAGPDVNRSQRAPARDS
jgi:hypothetical protein